MYAEEPAVFLRNKRFAAMRTEEPKRCSYYFSGRESLTTDFTLILTVAAIIIIEIKMGGTAERTDGILRDGFSVTALNGFDRFTILPVIVLKKELPVLFNKGFDDRKLINLKFLIYGRMRIIESPLFQGDISANKVNKPADLLMLVLN